MARLIRTRYCDAKSLNEATLFLSKSDTRERGSKNILTQLNPADCVIRGRMPNEFDTVIVSLALAA
jgi:hypothetical protein